MGASTSKKIFLVVFLIFCFITFCFFALPLSFFAIYLTTFSPLSTLHVLIAFYILLVFLHSLHLYSIVILFVVFVFLFQSFGPFFERLPKFPVPPLKLRDFSLEAEPRDIGCAADLDFCFAAPTVCKVCFLHFGQYLLISLGTFILFF